MMNGLDKSRVNGMMLLGGIQCHSKIQLSDVRPVAKVNVRPILSILRSSGLGLGNLLGCTPGQVAITGRALHRMSVAWRPLENGKVTTQKPRLITTEGLSKSLLMLWVVSASVWGVGTRSLNTLLSIISMGVKTPQRTIRRAVMASGHMLKLVGKAIHEISTDFCVGTVIPLGVFMDSVPMSVSIENLYNLTCRLLTPAKSLKMEDLWPAL